MSATTRCIVCDLPRVSSVNLGICGACNTSMRRNTAYGTDIDLVAWAAKRARHFAQRAAKSSKREPVYCSATSAHGVQCQRFVREGAALCGYHALKGGA